jgi:hypothetical protein
MRARKKADRPVEIEKLSAVLQKVYGKRSGEARISPAWLATETMIELDPGKKSPELVYHAAHLQLRHLARALCRDKFDPESDESAEQHELFPDLQKRYPIAHGPNVEPEYVLLEEMTEADVRFNVRRMRRASETLRKRADALEAWWESKPKKAA